MSEERIEEKSSELNALLTAAVNRDASDIFLIPGMPAAFKIHGQIEPIDERKILPGEMDHFIRAIYALTGGRDMERVLRTGDDDFSFSIQGLSRFRASVMKQRGSLAAVIRLVRFDLPSPENLHIPESIMKLSQLPRGLVLVTGPAGSGKSTTLACIIDRINRRMGYRLFMESAEWPESVRMGETFEIRSIWSNTGVAPCYKGGHPCFTLKDDQGGIVSTLVVDLFDLKDLPVAEPQAAVKQEVVQPFRIAPRYEDKAGTFFRSCKPGTYTLYVSAGMRDGTPIYELPYDGDDGKHRYRLGQITLME